MEEFCFGFGEFGGGFVGADAGVEEGFAGVDVTDSDDLVVVHDVEFDGGVAISSGGVEVFWGEVGTEGFRAEFGEERVGFYFVWNPESASEAAGIVIAHLEVIL